MKEIISLHIGQAGVQVGNAWWEIFCMEHGIDPDGKIRNPYYFSEYYDKNTFFIETLFGKFLPRALMIDLEPTVVDQVKTSIYRDLFHPEFLLTGKEDAANNYARGKYGVGKEMADISLDKIRKLVESCESFQGFMITNAVGGGSGSGLGSLLLERLSVDYGKKTKMDFAIYPSPQISTSTVEPYNAVLATHSLLEHTDVCVILDNQAIYDICRERLQIQRPCYTNLNRLIAQVSSSITSSFRFEGPINATISELQTNLIPFPNFNFLLTSYSPLIQQDRMCFSGLSTDELTHEVFDRSSMMVKCFPKFGKYMASSLIYRGDNVPKDINAAIRSIKRRQTVKFADWCPTGFKVAINYQPPVCLPGGDLVKTMRACSMVCNTTALSHTFDCLSYKFDLMHKKNSFMHWYLAEGMEENEFTEARERLAVLQKDYEEAEMETSDIEDETN